MSKHLLDRQASFASLQGFSVVDHRIDELLERIIFILPSQNSNSVRVIFSVSFTESGVNFFDFVENIQLFQKLVCFGLLSSAMDDQQHHTKTLEYAEGREIVFSVL